MNDKEMSTAIADNSAELHLLSAMLIRNGECIPAVAAILDADDFYSPQNRVTFRTIVKLYAEGTPPNLLSIMDELRKTGELDKVGAEYVFALDQWESTNAYAVSHAKIVKEKSNLRCLQFTSAKIAQEAQKGITPLNQLISAATTAFSALITSTEAAQLSNINDYFKNDFLKDLEEMSRFNGLSTGFDNIDEVQILLPGLYLVGAEPAIGKTTFVWQILEQMARNGCKCIYCSYEMSKKALYRKSAARAIFEMDNVFSELTASNLHRNLKFLNHEITIRAAMSKVLSANMDLNVLEMRDENVDALIRTLKPFCTGDKQPVIAIDYIQIIPSDKEIKAAVDETLRKLQVFQRDTNAIIFCISSFNRANYRFPVTFASFKESGACEYSADVMWGLQLNVVNKLGNKKPLEVDEAISDAIRAQPREIQLKCIKNRNGAAYSCYFKYYSANDTFKVCEAEDFIGTGDDDIPAHIADSVSGTGNSTNGNSDDD